MASSSSFSFSSSLLPLLTLLQAFLLLGAVVGGRMSDDISFDENYIITWGNDHVLSLNQGRLVQLSLDQSSGFNLLLLPPLLQGYVSLWSG